MFLSWWYLIKIISRFQLNKYTKSFYLLAINLNNINNIENLTFKNKNIIYENDNNLLN